MCYNPLYDALEGYEAVKAQEDSAVDANATTGTRLEETAKDFAEKTDQGKAQEYSAMDAESAMGTRLEQIAKNSAEKTDEQSKTKYKVKKETPARPGEARTQFDNGKYDAERKLAKELPKELIKYNAKANKMNLAALTKSKYKAEKKTAAEIKGGGTPLNEGKYKAKLKLPNELPKDDAETKKTATEPGGANRY